MLMSLTSERTRLRNSHLEPGALPSSRPRRNVLYGCGIISLTVPPAQLPQQLGQEQQILNPEAGPPSRQDEEWVRPLHVRPAGRQRTDTGVLLLAEEHPVLAPAVGVSDQLELPAGQRVEWVDYSESPRIVAMGSS